MKTKLLIIVALMYFCVACGLTWKSRVNNYIEKHPERPQEIMHQLEMRQLAVGMTVKEAELSIIFFHQNQREKSFYPVTSHSAEMFYHIADNSRTIYLSMVFELGFLVSVIYW